MSYKLLLLKAGLSGDVANMVDSFPALLAERLPEVEVYLARDETAATAMIAEVDAAFGVLGPELFAQAAKLRWIQSPQAGPDPAYWHPALVASDVAVTNMRGVYSDHIGAHIMGLLLSFARGLHVYRDRQREHRWQGGVPTTHLPEATALVVGVGGIGAEAARLCKAFGMTVLATDPRVAEAPPGVDELGDADALDEMLARADFVIVTAPETPATQGLFDAERFACMRDSAVFINIGRGPVVVLDDLNAALRDGTIAGAALDVFEIEPLPAEHPLWDAPGMLVTPHVATAGPYLVERWTQVFLDNAARFADGRPLQNVVDKANWF